MPPRTEVQKNMIKQSARRFDAVRVQTVGGAVLDLNREQYRSLPLTDRITYLQEGKIRFFLAGIEIPCTEAVKSVF